MNNPIALLPGIPGHRHSVDASGKLSCGCDWPPIDDGRYLIVVSASGRLELAPVRHEGDTVVDADTGEVLARRLGVITGIDP